MGPGMGSPADTPLYWPDLPIAAARLAPWPPNRPRPRFRRAGRPGVLISLLVLPLYLPPRIFGTGAVEASLAAEGPRAHLLLLAALSLAALPLAPIAAAAALRQALD